MTPDQERQVLAILDGCEADGFTREEVEVHRGHAMSALTEAAGGPDALAANPFLTQLADLADFAALRGF